MRIYIDTNVYLDLFFNRSSAYVDFAQEANTIFHRSKGCEFEIIISDVLTSELTRYACLEPLEELRSFLGTKARSVRKMHTDELRAQSFNTHRADALHIALAERCADCIITRNVKDFKDSSIPVFLPESF